MLILGDADAEMTTVALPKLGLDVPKLNYCPKAMIKSKVQSVLLRQQPRLDEVVVCLDWCFRTPLEPPFLGVTQSKHIQTPDYQKSSQPTGKTKTKIHSMGTQHFEITCRPSIHSQWSASKTPDSFHPRHKIQLGATICQSRLCCLQLLELGEKMSHGPHVLQAAKIC